MGPLILLETHRLLRERAALVLLVLLLLCCALALVNGRSLMQQQIDGRAIAAAQAEANRDRISIQLAMGAAPADAVLFPFRVTETVLAPVPLLVDFSAGRASFENYSATVNLRSRADNLFHRTQLNNPELSARGSFDLGFVAVVIVPLLLVGLGYGLFTADRDSGAARLVLAQGGSLLRLMLARSLPRLALVILPLALTVLLLLALGPALPGRTAAALLWLLIAMLLLMFWWSVILLANSLRITAETSALALVGLWALLTLVLPPLIAATAQLSHPPPSRFEQIALGRAAEVASTTEYENDHPELAEDGFGQRLASVRKTVEIGRGVDGALAPLSARFDQQLRGQQQLERRLAWASPPLVAGDAMIAVAGTGGEQWAGFRQASQVYVETLKAALADFIDRGAIMEEEDLAALPRFDWAPSPTRPLSAMALLLLLAATAMTLATQRLRHLRLD